MGFDSSALRKGLIDPGMGMEPLRSSPTWIPDDKNGYTHSVTGAKLVRTVEPPSRRGAREKVKWELHVGRKIYDLGPKATFDKAERILHRASVRRVAQRFCQVSFGVRPVARQRSLKP